MILQRVPTTPEAEYGPYAASGAGGRENVKPNPLVSSGHIWNNRLSRENRKEVVKISRSWITMYQWMFRNQFYRHAFGPRVQLAAKKIQLALAEIRMIASKDSNLAAEGAVLFLQKISPALENSDVHSPIIRKAVDTAISTLAPIIAKADASSKQRHWWLKKLLEAHERDRGLLIEPLTKHWGEMCASKTVAWDWADRLLGRTKKSLAPNMGVDDYFHGTTACFSALLASDRFRELINLVAHQDYWAYNIWAVKAYVAQGKPEKAIQYAQSCRNPQTDDGEIDRVCREIRATMKK